MSKFKIGDKVCSKYLGVFEVIALSSDEYLCYQEGFNGHSGNNTLGFDYFKGTKYEGQCYWFGDSDLEFVEPKLKKGDKVKCITQTKAIGVEIGGVYTIKDPQHHYGTYYGKRHNHVCLEEVSSTPNESCLELYSEEVKQPTSYREMSPDSTVKVKIGDYEFDCPIKELLMVCKLSGCVSGNPRPNIFWRELVRTLDFQNNLRVQLGQIDARFENVNFVYQEYFKPFYDKQEEKDLLLKDIVEQKAILKNQEELLKELEDKYNSL